LNNEYDNTSATLTEIERQLATTKTKLGEACDAHAATKSDKDGAIKQLRSELSSSDKRSSELTKQLRSSETSVSELRNDLKVAGTLQSKTQNTLDSVTETAAADSIAAAVDLAASQEETRAEADAHASTKSTLDETMAILVQMTDENVKTVAERDEMTAKYESTQASFDALTADHASLNAEHKTAVTTAATEADVAAAELEIACGETATTRAILEETKTTLELSNHTNFELNSKLTHKTAQHNAAVQECAAKDQERAALQEVHNELTTEKDELAAALTACKKELSDSVTLALHSQKVHAEELAEMQHQIGQANTSQAATEAKMALLRAEHSRVTEVLSSTASSLKEAEDEVRGLTKKVAKLMPVLSEEHSMFVNSAVTGLDTPEPPAIVEQQLPAAQRSSSNEGYFGAAARFVGIGGGN